MTNEIVSGVARFFCSACEGFYPQDNFSQTINVEGDSYRYVTTCSHCGKVSDTGNPIPISIKEMGEGLARQTYQELMNYNDDFMRHIDRLAAGGWTTGDPNKPMSYKRLVELYHEHGEWHSLCLVHYANKAVR